jgi:predicted CXXCH cytochrome family protein
MFSGREGRPERGSVDLRTYIVIVAGCACIVATGCVGSSPRTMDRSQVSNTLPEIKKDCASCHLPGRNGKLGELKQKISDLCLGCHSDRKAPAEHRVDIFPTMQVTGLPLTDGMITCFTCHDPHRNQYGNLLRMKATDLCLRCHPL